MKTRAIMIAGAVSGVGKTTVATGLMGALAQRGLRVQPFKTGPDMAARFIRTCRQYREKAGGQR